MILGKDDCDERKGSALLQEKPVMRRKPIRNLSEVLKKEDPKDEKYFQEFPAAVWAFM